MTWEELKAKVDKWLSESGFPQSVEISMIDILWPVEEEIDVFLTEHDKLIIRDK